MVGYYATIIRNLWNAVFDFSGKKEALGDKQQIHKQTHNIHKHTKHNTFETNIVTITNIRQTTNTKTST